jgi:hypothetical protein
MRRTLFALPLVALLVGAGPALADYILIRVDVNHINQLVNSGGGGGQVGAPPGGMVGGYPAPPGGNIGGYPGAPPGGMVGAPPGGNGGGFAPGGARFGSGGAGIMGSMGSGAGFMGGPPGMAGGQPAAAGEDPDAVYLTVYVEASKVALAGKQYIHVDHRWGKKAFLPLFAPQVFTYAQIRQPTMRAKIRDELNKAKDALKDKKGDKQKAFDTLRFVAGRALSHSLLKEFHQAMDELVKLDANHPSVKQYLRVQKELGKPFTGEDPASRPVLAELKSDGYRELVSDQGHYALWTNLPPSQDGDMRHRLALLEQTLESFYYWFAIQENLTQPATPKYRLAVLVPSTLTEYQSRHVQWGSVSTVADGFTARRPNVVILSPSRQDDAYQLLKKSMDSLLRLVGQGPEDLLSGKIWNDRNAMSKGSAISVLQALVLVQKAADEEGERAAISHEGTRQLLVASNLFPRNVSVPEWVLAGLCGYFETPVTAVYPGVGLPSWSNLISMKYFQKKGKFARPADVLYHVVTDRYFRQAQRSAEEALENKDDEKLQKTAREDAELANSTAWGLAYYLAKNRKLGMIVRYGEELNKMPRDLDLDERALQACFARAFDLGDVKDASTLSPQRLKSFADTWLADIQSDTLEVGQVEDASLRDRIAQSQPRRKTPPPAGNYPPGAYPPGAYPPGASAPANIGP